MHPYSSQQTDLGSSLVIFTLAKDITQIIDAMIMRIIKRAIFILSGFRNSFMFILCFCVGKGIYKGFRKNYLFLSIRQFLLKSIIAGMVANS